VRRNRATGHLPAVKPQIIASEGRASITDGADAASSMVGAALALQGGQHGEGIGLLGDLEPFLLDL